MKWILLIGDGPRASGLLKRLRKEGFHVTAVANMELAAIVHLGRFYRAIICAGPGTEALAAWLERIERDRTSPCIHSLYLVLGDEPLTSNNGLHVFRYPSDTTAGLLIGHLRALLRRQDGYERHYRLGPLGVDPVRGRASLYGRPLPLRPMEFSLLLCLLQAPGHSATHLGLLQRLWSSDSPNALTRLRRLVCDLRQQLQGKSSHVDIVNAYGKRYRLVHRAQGDQGARERLRII